MPNILHRLPLTRVPQQLVVSSGASADLRPDQIIAWVSLSRPGLSRLPHGTWRFPAVIDTGCALPFVMHQTHWDNWVGAARGWFQQLSDGSVYRQPAKRYRAHLWIYPNRPNDLAEISPDREPFQIHIHSATGIIISSVTDTTRSGAIDGTGRPLPPQPLPRLPLIGLPALKWNDLILTVDAGRGRVRLRKPRQWWFLRW